MRIQFRNVEGNIAILCERRSKLEKRGENTTLIEASTLIPILSVVSLFLTVKSKTKFLNRFNFWAILLVIQFSFLLILNKLLPIVMWK